MFRTSLKYIEYQNRSRNIKQLKKKNTLSKQTLPLWSSLTSFPWSSLYRDSVGHSQNSANIRRKFWVISAINFEIKLTRQSNGLARTFGVEFSVSGVIIFIVLGISAVIGVLGTYIEPFAHNDLRPEELQAGATQTTHYFSPTSLPVLVMSWI